MAWIMFGFAMLIIALGADGAVAQEASESSQTGAASAPAPGMLPGRLEFGGYSSWVDNGFGAWRGFNAEIWLARDRRFIPAFLFDSQTRPTGTQQNYAFMSYMNWTESFYTVQSVSGAPQKSEQAIYFPKIRYDVKGYWKFPPDKNFLLGAGYTHFDFGRPGRGQIYSVGALYYRKKYVLDGNLFINQSKPGNLWSASGSLSVQYGTEGEYWLGVTASGGRELYRIEGLTPLDVRWNSYTLDLFYRRWISRQVGYSLKTTFQEKFDAYKRAGVSARLFFEF